jgi:hypothetical protein
MVVITGIKKIFSVSSCRDPLHIPPGSSSDTHATSFVCPYHIGNVKDEEDLDMQDEEGEVNVKREKGIDSEEEECRAIKNEGMYSEEEGKEEDVDTKEEEEDVDIKEYSDIPDAVKYNLDLLKMSILLLETC